ncbi:unnamed protein product [Rodentolepis nana]|uniref:Nucleotid_trans domain-containing protein n=1 Tax=Rodentolepis nana TaxID=102285 RepID=A0A0R3TKQ0_RODNA|nr:unnamed protein product [Rodentolepis nana]
MSVDKFAQIDDRMHDVDPGAIHIMQMVLGSKSPRFQMTFLKSLFTTHFQEESAKPIHLHLLTDKATQFILDGIIQSWRVDKLRTTFYAAEPIQSKITWMLSHHSATKVATMKMYLPEILNSTVPKVLLLDTDTVFLDDVVKLWDHFENFDKYQFLGMALEQAPMYFNFKKIRGRRVDHGYNAGIMLWDLRKLTQQKWESIWKPTFHRAFKISPYFGAAEQTLLNAVIVDNPAIFYPIPCTWNVQMFELGTPKLCKSTWNSPAGKDIPQPQLLHADKWNKLEHEFKLSGPNGESMYLIKYLKFVLSDADITTRYINIRSLFHMRNGYEFRKKLPSMKAFDIRNVMAKLHPGGRVLTPNTLCRTKLSEFEVWCGINDEFSFTIEHRIHPLYISGEYKKITQDESGVTLAIGAGFAQFSKIEEIAKQWNGPISLAIEATDLEAHKLLSKVENSHILRRRKNIFYHIVFQHPVSTSHLYILCNLLKIDLK